MTEVKIDWSQAPEGFNWWAKDGDDNSDAWFFNFLCAPSILYDLSHWAISTNCIKDLNQPDMGDIDWRDSLRLRPGVTDMKLPDKVNVYK